MSTARPRRSRTPPAPSECPTRWVDRKRQSAGAVEETATVRVLVARREKTGEFYSGAPLFKSPRPEVLAGQRRWAAGRGYRNLEKSPRRARPVVGRRAGALKLSRNGHRIRLETRSRNRPTRFRKRSFRCSVRLGVVIAFSFRQDFRCAADDGIGDTRSVCCWSSAVLVLSRLPRGLTRRMTLRFGRWSTRGSPIWKACPRMICG